MKKFLGILFAFLMVVAICSSSALADAPEIYSIRSDLGTETFYTGGLVNIVGLNFGNPGLTSIPGRPVDPGHSVSFGGTAATTYYSWVDNYIRVQIPSSVGAGTVSCQVTTPGGSVSQNITVVQSPIGSRPQIERVDPTGGSIGDLVTLYGSNFGSSRVPQISNVLFGLQLVASYKSWADTKIEVYVPDGVTTELTTVAVTTTGVVSNPVMFMVFDADQPSIYATIDSPTAGTFIESSVDITATAYSYLNVQKVEFYADGQLLGTDTSSPYAYTWDCSQAVVGEHVILARAYDVVGAYRDSQVTVFKNSVIPAPSTTWYLPEGCTDHDFETWVLIQNPGSEEVRVDATYMMPGGATETREYTVGAQRRRSIKLNEELPPTDVSTKLVATGNIICERAMYWNDRNGGHASIGLTSMSPIWYLAEGCTAYGFDEWILLMNPGDSATTARITYMVEGGVVGTNDYPLEAHSRRTVQVSGDCPDSNVSAKVESTDGRDIAVERSMYWNDREDGHCTIGSRATSRGWYLAEGATYPDYKTWVLVENPQDESATVTATFMGQGGVLGTKQYPMNPQSRLTIDVNEEVPADQDVSTKIEADQPVIAERAVYYRDKAAGQGSIGSPTPSPIWYLAEGCSASGFTTWVLIQNADATQEATPTIIFMSDTADPVTTTVTVSPQGRASINVADYAPNANVAIQVQSALNVNLVVERAMYWEGSTSPGASGSVGVRSQ